MASTASSARLSKNDFEALSEFRYRLRCFLQHADVAAKSEGLTPLQFLVLIHVKGRPGRAWALVGELAERLQAAPHGVAALLTRCERAGLVERRKGAPDRRQVRIHLTPAGNRTVTRIASRNRAELESLSKVLAALRRRTHPSGARP